jgi:mannose-1-phosphate guanylyltransferase
VIATLTADHWIEPLADFREALADMAWGAGQAKVIYTMGIAPTGPATGYGYLELGQAVYPERSLRHFQVSRFKEKPDLATAQAYLESGNYLWNSGMFAWRSSLIVEQLSQNVPRHIELLEPVCEDRGEALVKAFEALDKISIDFAVLEKAPQVFCLRPRFNWTDLGGWLALEPFLQAGADGNASRGSIHTLDAKGNLVFCQDSTEQVALIGVEDLMVVRVQGKTLILPRHRGEDIKKLLERDPLLQKS